MAVNPNKPPAMVRDYWPKYHKRSITLIILMQTVGALVIAGALVVGGVIAPNVAFWIIVGVILIVSIALNLILFTQLSAPLKDLTSALTHISGEPSQVKPPSPNAQHFERDGFKPLLQLIYELASDEGQPRPPTTDAATPQAFSDLATALNNTSAGFIVLGTDGRVVYANKNAPVHTDPDGSTVVDLVEDDDFKFYDWLKECEEKAVRSEKTWQRVANKIPGEEDRKLYDITASYDKGSSAQVVITLFERTELYLPEDEDLDFLAFAAHELRGPITVIRGYLDVLDDELAPKLDSSQVELMNRLVVSANRLSSYVNNILNASRYDRRHLKVHLQEDTLANIYDTIRDDMELRASSQNRLLAVSLPTDLPTVAADPTSIGEVLSNLIDNAIKYSNEGGAVNVTAAREGDFVKVAVEDRGIGMPGNVVSNLFHKFYRSHRSRETVAGTGIGLYICKAIIESHGGQISVRSVEGRGSTFEFTLPIYSTVAEKLKAHHNSNEEFINHTEGGWIKNHAMYRG